VASFNTGFGDRFARAGSVALIGLATCGARCTPASRFVRTALYRFAAKLSAKVAAPRANQLPLLSLAASPFVHLAVAVPPFRAKAPAFVNFSVA